MTRLFLRFYLGVLLILFLAWYIYGIASERFYASETGGVIEDAHSGGVRLVAEELDAVPIEDRAVAVQNWGERFDCPVAIADLATLPPNAQRRIHNGEDVVFYIGEGGGGMVASPLSNGTDVAILGALPAYTHIEASLSAGVRLAVSRLQAAPEEEQASVLASLQQRFGFPLTIISWAEVPSYEQQRLASGEDVVFYGNEDEERFFVVTPLQRRDQLLRFGPFPNFARVERRALTTTLAMTLLLAGLAIAFLLRPVAQQLRTVEDAAKTIAGGDLSARVDERRLRAARPFAQAFNNMADRTETLAAHATGTAASGFARTANAPDSDALCHRTHSLGKGRYKTATASGFAGCSHGGIG